MRHMALSSQQPQDYFILLSAMPKVGKPQPEDYLWPSHAPNFAGQKPPKTTMNLWPVRDCPYWPMGIILTAPHCLGTNYVYVLWFGLCVFIV